MTRTRATLSLTTAALAAAVLLPAGSASAAPVKGLQDQEMTVNYPDLRATFFDEAKDAKVKMLRFNTRWDGKDKSPDLGQVGQIRAALEQGATTGVTSAVISPNITGDASFNPRGHKKGPLATKKVSAKAYTSYIKTLAENLKGIDDIQLYYAPLNEPNWYRHLPKRGNAALYRKLHNIAYKEIRKIDRDAKILYGELVPYARKLSKNYPNGQSQNAGSFTRDVLGLSSNWKSKRGTKKARYEIKADAVSLHTYDFKADPRKKRKDRDDWTQANLGYAKSDLKKAARTKRISSSAVKQIHLTEFAYKTSGSDRISTSKASTYLKRAWSIAKKQKVKSFLWYQLRDPTSTEEGWQSGLQSRSGTARKTWKTFRALK